MPFKSEKQRRYLWANEPEIARDWTDTYGSRVEAALGGIMRLGYLYGGLTHPDGRRGFFRGAEADARAGRGAMSPGTGMQGQGRGLGQDSKGDAIRRQNIINVSKLGAPPGMTTSTGHTPKGPKGFLGGLLGGIWDAYTTLSPTYNVYKALTTKLTPLQQLQANINKGYDVSNPAEMHGLATRTGPTTGPDRGGNEYIPPQYINDLYAQNIMEEDDIDIDTSTGNMQDWVQRFKVKDPYRQDRGALDSQIQEYVSKLYT